MKIAVPVTHNNKIDDHFGHCEFYSVFSITEGKITDKQTIPSILGCGCKSNIASVLAADGVTIMLAGGIGGGAINVLNNAGIEVVRGCSGDATKVVELFVSGSISDSGESCKSHTTHNSDTNSHVCNH
jgi:predicted Fe-Mo cluster-binding NifX family protein